MSYLSRKGVQVLLFPIGIDKRLTMDVERTLGTKSNVIMRASQSMSRETTWQTSSSFWSKKDRGCLSFRMKSVFEAKKKDRTGFVGPFSFLLLEPPETLKTPSSS
jgi:hypothetical protein